MRILNIAHGEFLMLGAFLTWAAHTQLGLSPLLMVPLSFAAADGLGLAVHRLTFRRLTRTSPNLDVFEARGLMVSFGLMFLVQNFAPAGLGRRPARLRLPGRAGGHSRRRRAVRGQQAAALRAGAGLQRALIVRAAAHAAGQGRARADAVPTGAQLVGIDTERLHPLMFGIGLGLSGVAGCLLSMTYTISPSMGEPYTVTALIVITLGGFGSMGGALAGGLALGVIEAVGMHFTNPSLKSLLSYGIFIAVLLWKPNGLFTSDEARPPMNRDWLILLALAGWALAVPHYGSEFVVSLALTCLMYAALAVQLEPVLRHHALPVAGHRGLLRHRRLHQRAHARAAALGGVIALGAAVAAGVALVMGAAVLHLRGTYFAVLTFGMTELIRHAITYWEKQVTGTVGRVLTVVPERDTIYLTVLGLAVLAVATASSCGAAASAWRWPASAPTSSAPRRWASTPGW
jgi:branched-chain amino acid transport system permease protein